MFHNNRHSKLSSPNIFSKQSGISMAFLLFVIIIVSLLAAALMRLNADSDLSNAHQVITTRAFFAAETGAQIQAMKLFPIGGGAPICDLVSPPYNFSTSGLNNCIALVTCQIIPISTGTPPVTNNYYDVTSQGQCNSGQLMQATRTIQVRLRAL